MKLALSQTLVKKQKHQRTLAGKTRNNNDNEKTKMGRKTTA